MYGWELEGLTEVGGGPSNGWREGNLASINPGSRVSRAVGWPSWENLENGHLHSTREGDGLAGGDVAIAEDLVHVVERIA